VAPARGRPDRTIACAKPAPRRGRAPAREGDGSV